MEIFILGANGFIGSHVCEAILMKTDWKIHAIDILQNNLIAYLKNPRFHFYLGDMTENKRWVEEHIKKSDVVIPLAAIATPAQYVENPLRIFELDFEAILHIIRQCVFYKKYLLFPSTSEVYGMCKDDFFDEEESHLVTGPIHKERWIYASSKQLLDRIIYAYGKHQQLNYTLFRPFNWYGPRLDNIFNPKPNASRVLTQFIGNILRGEDLLLVGGGIQKRSFTYIDDAMDALLKIIENKNHCANQKIFNIGNPDAIISIYSLAELLLSFLKDYPHYQKPSLRNVPAVEMYGEGYQDIPQRKPNIVRAQKYLNWQPRTGLNEGLQKMLAYYL